MVVVPVRDEFSDDGGHSVMQIDDEIVHGDTRNAHCAPVLRGHDSTIIVNLGQPSQSPRVRNGSVLHRTTERPARLVKASSSMNWA